MADARITVDVEPVLRFDNITSQIEAKLNEISSKPFPIKIKLNVSGDEKKLNAIQDKLKSLGDPVSVNVGDIFGKGFDGGLKQISDSLGKISASLAGLGDSSNLKELTSDMKALAEAMRESGNIKLSLNSNPVAQNAKYGSAARKAIAELQEQARAIENVFMQVTKTRDNLNAVTRAGAGTELLPGNLDRLIKMQNPTGSLTEQLDTLREYIRLLNDIAAAKNIDITPATSQFSKSADELIADTDKIRSGEEELEKTLQKLKSVFHSGVDSEALTQNLTTIATALQNISTAIGTEDIGTEKFKSLTQSVAEATQGINELLTAINNLDGTNVTPGASSAGGSGGSGGGSSSKGGKSFKIGTQAFNVVDNKIQGLIKTGESTQQRYTAAIDGASKESYAAITSALEVLNGLDEKLNSEKLTVEEFGKAWSKAKADITRAQAEIIKAGENRKATKPVEDLAAQYSILGNKAETAGNKVKEALSKATKAEHGKSSAHYEGLKDAIKEYEAIAEAAKTQSTPAEDLEKRLGAVNQSVKNHISGIKEAGEYTQTWGEKVGGVVKRFATWFGISRIIMSVVRTFKQMVSASMEIESAMTRIQIVTGATDSQMTQFFETAATQAKELGKSITEVASSIETFSRLGYSLPDATELSKYATVMANVGDVTVDEATTGITSIIKGYNLQASDAEHVADVLINVGQKYAISAGELMEAFERGGAALAASGTSFEQSAGLLAATNSALQNSSTTGTLWKTKPFCLCV